MTYKVTVDDYVALTIQGAQNTFLSSPYSASNTAVVMQAGNGTSPGLYYVRKSGSSTNVNNVYTILSIVIQLDDGYVSDVIWDTACFACDSSCDASYNQTDGQMRSNCYDPNCATLSTNGSCDPKIYVSWLGTDSRGLRLESAGLRISNFVQYSISDVWASAGKIVNATYTPSQVSYCSVAGNCQAANTTTNTTNTTTTTTASTTATTSTTASTTASTTDSTSATTTSTTTTSTTTTDSTTASTTATTSTTTSTTTTTSTDTATTSTTTSTTATDSTATTTTSTTTTTTTTSTTAAV
eukprot:CAMPEP_0176436656 /NCGR_PEP_ID=MMETSP0127-20121128/18110_1 /TAXON_ID=938130 /ORGANISM="Platyophrya macrostoma, Strain WH" /LENGTH=296 /DNA_ID=CAMNT_0017820041 /DNA_START=213 /DNA_END=1104 /DNA_ORIENTATION=-